MARLELLFEPVDGAACRFPGRKRRAVIVPLRTVDAVGGVR